METRTLVANLVVIRRYAEQLLKAVEEGRPPDPMIAQWLVQTSRSVRDGVQDRQAA